MKSVHFDLNLPSLVKKCTNLVRFLTFFDPLPMSIFVADFLICSHVTCVILTCKKLTNYISIQHIKAQLYQNEVASLLYASFS